MSFTAWVALVWFAAGVLIGFAIRYRVREHRGLLRGGFLVVVGGTVFLISQMSLWVALAFALPVLVGIVSAARARHGYDGQIAVQAAHGGVAGAEQVATVRHLSGVPSWPPEIDVTLSLTPNAMVFTPTNPDIRLHQVARSDVQPPSIYAATGGSRDSTEMRFSIPIHGNVVDLRMSLAAGASVANNLRSLVIGWM